MILTRALTTSAHAYPWQQHLLQIVTPGLSPCYSHTLTPYARRNVWARFATGHRQNRPMRWRCSRSTACTPLAHDQVVMRQRVKCVMDANGYAIYFSRSPIPGNKVRSNPVRKSGQRSSLGPEMQALDLCEQLVKHIVQKQR